MIKFFKKTILAVLAFLPAISFAASWLNYNNMGVTRHYGGYGSGGGGGLWNLFSIVMGILSQAVIILVAFAVIFFLYGILKYITAGDDEEKRTKMKNVMIYGIIGLFVMVSFWGIVNILINTFQLDTSPYVSVPYFDSSSYSGKSSYSSNGGNWGETSSESDINWGGEMPTDGFGGSVP